MIPYNPAISILRKERTLPDLAGLLELERKLLMFCQEDENLLYDAETDEEKGELIKKLRENKEYNRVKLQTIKLELAALHERLGISDRTYELYIKYLWSSLSEEGKLNPKYR